MKIYAWVIFILAIAGLFYRIDTKRHSTYEEEVLNDILDIIAILPLIGRILGWW